MVDPLDDCRDELTEAREQVEALKGALETNRTIGTAVGLTMAEQHVGQAEAVSVLKQRSQRSNVRLRTVAEQVVRDAEAVVPEA